MPENSILIPELDRPAAEFDVVLPSARILEGLIAAGHRYGCWVLRTPAGEPVDDERDLHFENFQAAAAAELAVTGRYAEPGQSSDGLAVIQLPVGCFTLSCAECRQPLTDEDFGYGTVHFESLTDLESFAEDCDWTTDGRLWNCSTCPPLQVPPGWAAGKPGSLAGAE